MKKSVNKHVRTRISNIRENGFEPIVKKIACSSEQIAFDLEIGLIKRIGRKDLGLGTLFNHTDGGEGSVGAKRPDLSERNKLGTGKPSWNKGLKSSKETCIKISIAAKERKPISEETRMKMREAKLGNNYAKAV